MSNEILNQCWKLPIPQAAKFVLISLADQANDDGICWPSVSFICVRTCLSERTVQGAKKHLERIGVIRVEKNAGTHGSDRITITPAGFTPAGDAPPQELRPTANAPPPAGAAPLPLQELRHPPQELLPNPQEPSVNHQESKKKRTREKVGLGIEVLIADGVAEQVAKDWFAVRKSKGIKILTATTWGGVKLEATKAGLSINDAIRIAVKKNWAGFEASWNWSGANTHPGKMTVQVAHAGFDQIDYQKDADEWNATN